MTEDMNTMRRSFFTLRNMLLLFVVGIVGTYGIYQVFIANAQVSGVGDGEYEWEAITNTNFDRPLYMVEIPDDSGRLAVVEQRGRIFIIDDGEVLSEPFLDISNLDLPGGNEQGLLGLAFHPDYAENGHFFINYTQRENEATVVARYQVSEDDVNLADADSRLELLVIEQPNSNHNGGMIVFGPDGNLYISLGDGGSAGDPLQHGQNIETPYGSILRINVDNTSEGDLYEIPEDNPFVDAEEGKEGNKLIWMYGLRNPWRFSFDMETGDIYIADVGQNQYEEVNYVPAGEGAGVNFGWGNYEANSIYNGRPELSDVEFPVAVYEHNRGCSVTGGYVYRGDTLPELQGSYFYGDFCSGIVWQLTQQDDGTWQNDVFLDTDFLISSFAQDADGELYLIDQNSTAYKLVKSEE